MMQITVKNGLSFSEDDVVNLDDWIPDGEYNPHRVRPWLLHDHGFTVAVVFAGCEEDAIDEAADAGQLDRFRVTAADRRYDGKDEERFSYLGNAGEPFDIESLGIVELPNPKRSFTAQFAESFGAD